MAVYDQQTTSYSDVTPHIRVVSDFISLISPSDAPLVARIGMGSAREKFNLNLNGYKIEWLEDELDPLSGTLNNGTTVTTATLTITLADASVVQPGHVLLIDSEKVVVNTVNTANNQITVFSRAYGGTNATHAANATFRIIGMARLEGDDADFGPIVDIEAPYNYTSIFQKALNVSGTMQAISQYGIEDEFAYQANKAMPHMMRLVELAVFNGVRAAGTASSPRSMGGLAQYITTNFESVGTGTITKTAIDNLAVKLYNEGGNPDMLVTSPGTAQRIRGLLDSSSFVRTTQENTVFGMQPITRVSTQFYNDLELVHSRWCPPNRAYMLNSSKIGLYDLRPFGWHDLARVGDSKKGELIGEYSLAVGNEKGHGYIVSSATL